jgi:PAS domain S-box-containing protein
VYVVIEHESASAGDVENRLWMQLGTPAAEVNVNSEIVAWNDHMMALSGFSKEDMVGRSFLELCTVDAVQNVRCLLRCSLKGSGASTCKITLYTIAGIPKRIRLHAMAYRDGAGKLIRIVVRAQQTNEDKADVGATSTADLPDVDVFNNIVSDNSDGLWDEFRGQ